MWRHQNLAGVCLVGLLGAAGAARSADNMVFVPLPPCRVIDTRVPGAGGALAAGTPRSFVFRGPTINYQSPTPFPNQGGSTTGCGIPDLTNDAFTPQNVAKALAINIVAVAPAGAGDLRAWPANQTVPNASVLNYAVVSGLNIANGVIVPMCDEVSLTACAGGDITFRADVSGTQLVVDVVGYFHAGSAAHTVTNTALGHQALQANTTGFDNTATGGGALSKNTSGYGNTASGALALTANTSGRFNVAVGYGALFSNSAGDSNTAVGAGALAPTTASANTAVGAGALTFDTTGTQNVAVGYGAGQHVTTGSNNVAIGYNTGKNLTTGVGNILIENYGDAGDNLTTRLGGGQTRAFVAGIRGVTTANNDAVNVVIDSAGQLGTVSSSIRFKEDVHDLGDVSDRVLELRPVTFRYKRAFSNGEKPLQYGLIAEEVEKVFPGLVAYGQDGKPETVKYQVLPTLLLGELEKEHAALTKATAELEEARSRIREQDQQLAAVLKRLDALESRPGSGPPVPR